MKIVLVSILLYTIAMPAFCQTPQNSVETDIAVIKTDIQNLNGKIDSLETHFNRRFESLEKHFDRQNNIIIVCIGIPLAILAIGATVGSILAYRRNRKVDTFEKQIETLTQEIEVLKRRQIVNP